MSLRLVALAIILLPAVPAGHAEEPPQGARFEGLWQVMPNRQRPRGRPGVRGAGRRPIGTPADEKGLTANDYRVRRMMTDAGREAFDAFDPYDLPANNCISPGLPSIAMMPYLQEWRVEGDSLRITHESYSTRRSIHLDAEPPDNLELSHLGYATGRFEDDSLVIETAGLAATLGGLGRNAPSSDARRVTEHYRLLPGGDSLEGQITIADEKFLTRPLQLRVRLRRPEPTAELVLFPCDPEAARRHLDPRPARAEP